MTTSNLFIHLLRGVRGTALLTVAAAAALVATAPVHAATTLKIATASPPGSPWMRVLGEAAKEVEAATEGRVKFKFFPGGLKGDDTSVLRQVRVDALQGGLVVTSVFGNIYSDIQAYNLPMVFRDVNEVDAVRESMDPLLVKGLKDKGFVSFGLAEVGMAYAMSTKPARNISDARDLKVWVLQGDQPAARLLKAFGISPRPLTIGEVLPSLQTGAIDTVAAPPVATLPLLWHTRLKYVLDLPFMYVYGVFVVSERSLRRVAPADRAEVERIMGAAVALADRRNRADHDSAWQALQQQGLEVITPTPKEEAEWRSYAAKAVRQWVADGTISQPVYRTLTARLAELRAPPSGGGAQRGGKAAAGG